MDRWDSHRQAGERWFESRGWTAYCWSWLGRAKSLAGWHRVMWPSWVYPSMSGLHRTPLQHRIQNKSPWRLLVREDGAAILSYQYPLHVGASPQDPDATQNTKQISMKTASQRRQCINSELVPVSLPCRTRTVGVSPQDLDATQNTNLHEDCQPEKTVYQFWASTSIPSMQD